MAIPERDHIKELYRFTDKLYRSETLNDVYEAALATITCALDCSRASILLFDDASIMRFAAWRGLSSTFRRAVEGHSPWTRDVKEPQPVCIQNIETTDLPKPLKEIIRAEQIGALAFIPLVANGVLIGKFVTYYDAPHVFNDADMALAVTIARQLGFSLERRRAEEALRETQRQLESDLAATQQLQKISTQLIHASAVEVLYEMILDAAVVIMRSDFASMQMLYPERGELRLLAYRGFNPSTAAFFEWVRPAVRSTCGLADIEVSDFMAGSEELQIFRQTGIRAMQSTPLISRAGRFLGMISTHWGNSHQPSERDLRLLDLLVRQAADLIERKQAEVTDQRLAAIVDSSHDAIVSKDRNGLITTWNRGAERLFGYTSDEMIGRPIMTIIPLDRHHEEVRILERVRRGERIDPYETVRQRRDGTLIDVSVSVSPLRNAAGEVIGASKIARDVSERKKVEAALVERNLQLALAGRAALVGSYSYDVSQGVMQVSAGYAAIHGLPEGTTETSYSEWRGRVHPEDLERAERPRDQAFVNRRKEDNGEYRIVLSTGDIRWIERRGSISYGEDGRPKRVVGVNIDITERKQAEQHRNILNAELDHRVKNLLAIVSAVAAQTKNASSSIDGFLNALDSRIRSMAATHELLSSEQWQGISLRELLRRELVPYSSINNTDIKGPEVILSPEAAQTTALVLHELATNAAKYGALSNREGRVSVRWNRASNGKGPGPLAIHWRETGGPPVEIPNNSGYGSSVITELVPYELGGTARLEFSPEGVRCQLNIPTEWLAPANKTKATRGQKSLDSGTKGIDYLPRS